MAELLIGCGNSRVKKLSRPGLSEWRDLVTLDIDPDAKPDVLHDLEVMPYPFEDGTFGEIHAYEVLEHFGRQGDWRGWFAMWTEFYRIMQPSGYFFGSCPRWGSPWLWGDPGHTRYVGPESLTFLDQREYAKQVGKTSMTDYRHVWRGHFEVAHAEVAGDSYFFVLRRGDD